MADSFPHPTNTPHLRLLFQRWKRLYRSNQEGELWLNLPGHRLRLVSNRYSGVYEFTFDSEEILGMEGDWVNGRAVVDLFTVERDLLKGLENMAEWVAIVRDLAPTDKIQIGVVSDDMSVPQFGSAWFPVADWRSAVRSPKGPKSFFDTLLLHLNSGQVYYLNELKFRVKYTQQRAGQGGPLTAQEQWIKRKKHITWIEALFNDCFFQCLALALNPDRFGYLQRSKAMGARVQEGHKLRRQVGVHDAGQPVSFDEMKIYEETFKIQITIISATDLSILRQSEYKDFSPTLTMIWTGDSERGGHFHFVQPGKVHTLFTGRKRCKECREGWVGDGHLCKLVCPSCCSPKCQGHPSLNSYTVKCERCCLFFFDKPCKDRHMRVCRERVRCERCDLIYTPLLRQPHACDVVRCRYCNRKLTGYLEEHEHKCFVKPLPRPTETVDLVEVPLAAEPLQLAFYDYECYFNDHHEHCVYLVVLMTPEGSLQVFRNHNDFMEAVLELRNTTLIAHNASRYDAHFIKRWLMERKIKTEDVVNANAIMQMEIKDKGLRFIDSCRFIPTALRNFPRTFGLQELSKGYFPYRFFTEDHLDYIGIMPDVKWFDFQKMSPKEAVEAYAWHAEHSRDIVNLDKWCVDYCVDDVKVLAAGCRLFRQQLMELNQYTFDPFASLTIASVCMRTYRTLYMPPQSIGRFETEFRTNPRFEAWRKGYEIFTVLGRETIVGPRGMEVFCSCLDDGCPRCYGEGMVHPRTGMYMWQLRLRLVEWTRQAHVSMITYECQVPDAGPPQQGINVREGFFGGRTEAIKPYYRCEGLDEVIRYVDFTSLYPSVLWDSRMPIGHPVLLEGNQITQDLSQYFGFVRCQVTPPQDLYLPLLPSRDQGKLRFDNCTKEGTWTTIEVLKARELGYRIDAIHAVLHFAQSTTTLFRDYIRDFYTRKIEAGGWEKLGSPLQAERPAMLQAINDQLGIHLTELPEKTNPGLYYIAKLMLNSLWGKLAQREDFPNTIETFDESTFFKVLENDSLEISGIFFLNPVVRTIVYRTKSAWQSRSAPVNVPIAAFTTAHARLRLYALLEKLQHRVLYMDTDSVLFVDKAFSPVELPIGPLLGQLTDELSGGDWIVEYCSTGPKSYAYRTIKGKRVTKCKGIQLSQETSSRLDLNLMKRMVCEDPQAKIQVQPLQFVIGKDHSIATKQWEEGTGKTFRLTQDKRQWTSSKESCIDSFPFTDGSST